MGVGSGGLYLVYLQLFTDTPQTEAQGLNLAFFVFALLSSVIFHLIARSYRDKRVLLAMPCGMVTAILGSYLAGIVEPGLLKKALGTVFLIAGMYTLYSSEKQRRNRKKEEIRRKRGRAVSEKT